MARPKKQYCDYFSHDRDMRNHRKIKALRTKFGINGYAIWVMILEVLTGNNDNYISKTEMEFELLSGDFGVSVTEITDIIDFCIKLKILDIKNDKIYSESLNERLKPVYNKRKINSDYSVTQSRKNGVFVSDNTDNSVVSVTEMPQSKVNEIKVNKKEVDNNNFKDNSKLENNKKLESNTGNLANSNLYRKPNIPTYQQVLECFRRNKGTDEMAKRFFDKNESTQWYLNNSPIMNFSNLVGGYIETWNKNAKKEVTKEFNPYTATGTEKVEHYKKMQEMNKTSPE